MHGQKNIKLCITEIIQVTDSCKYFPLGPRVGQPCPTPWCELHFYEYLYYYQWIFIAHEILASTHMKLYILLHQYLFILPCMCWRSRFPRADQILPKLPACSYLSYIVAFTVMTCRNRELYPVYIYGEIIWEPFCSGRHTHTHTHTHNIRVNLGHIRSEH